MLTEFGPSDEVRAGNQQRHQSILVPCCHRLHEYAAHP